MKAVTAWIWIIISVVLGLITLVFGSLFILRQSEVAQKQLILQQFAGISEDIGRTCLKGGIGQTLYRPISIPENTRAIYVANESDQPPPDKVSEDITKRRSGVGIYICMQFFDENIPRCQQIDCDLNFTYIGTPSLQSTLQTLLARLSGNPPINKFYLKINKTDYNFVQTIAVPFVGDAIPNITQTS